MDGIKLRKTVRAGEFVFGTLIASPSPKWAEVVKKLGLDFVFIDSEHIPLDRVQIAGMCQMYKAMDIAPIVRISSPDPYAACMALDGGACGIVAPYIETLDQVKELYGAVKLRPLKGKILREVLDGKRKLDKKMKEYLARWNKGNLLIVNIESVPAIENLEEISGAEGLDALLIGPHDLSISMGIPEQYDHPTFNKAIKTIARIGRANGIGVGNHFSQGIDPEIRWAKDGVNIIIHSSDINAFYQGMNHDIAEIKMSLGKKKKNSNGAKAIDL